jgi:hypothetical protein
MTDDVAAHVDLAGYVLGKLDPAETEAFRAHLDGCAACRAELAGLEGIPDLLDQAVPAVPMPAGLRGRTLDAVRQAAAASAVDPAPAPAPAPVLPLAPRPRFRPVWGAVALAAAAALLLAILVPAVLANRVAPPSTVAMQAPGGQSYGQIRVTPTKGGGRILDVALRGLDQPPRGSQYSLWAVADDDSERTPNRVGLIQFSTGPDRAVRFQTFTTVPADRFPRFDVTLEPQDGDPGRNGPEVLLSRPA